jgi:putative heme-binding domain-containing protein
LAAAETRPVKKIVLIAGTKSHGPGEHEYEKGVKLLKHCLDTSPNLRGFKTEVYLDGWPRDEKVLQDASTILLFSDGSDRNEKAHPLLRGNRLQTVQRLMDRGVGFVAIHYTLFVPGKRGGEQFLDWIGGYFDYETGPKPRSWYSKIQTCFVKAEPASKTHPITRGLKPFPLKEEFYYNIRFRPRDSRRVPILMVPIPGEMRTQEVAWAVERKNGGRGFGFTGGHFHSNWRVADFCRMVLNALVWTAQGKVPDGGVQFHLPPDPDAPIRVLILTGRQHPAHDWQKTTRAIEEVLARDSRLRVTVVRDPEFLAKPALAGHDVLILNYMNFERPGLSDRAKANLLKYVAGGKGLVVVHFANGAFRDWPDYRKLVRRVWVDKKSGHDPYGRFVLSIPKRDHPITRGLKEYETTDELYFKQQGDLPIEALLTARSRVTGKQEPMAFVYNHGKGRVFQTVLGHDAAAIRTPGTAEVIRRGCVWAAGRPQKPVPAAKPRPAEATAPGKFGSALNARQVHAAAKLHEAYQQPPLTVECWAKLDSSAGYNLLVANNVKESNTHWEIFSMVQSGTFSAFLPGRNPSLIDSKVKIADGKWHYLEMVYEAGRVRLYVDAKQVADVKLKPAGGQRKVGPLYFGAYPPHGLGCTGLVDEVRLSRGVRAIADVPDKPFANDKDTVGLWHFDRLDRDAFEDSSRLKNPARLATAQALKPARAGPSSTTRLDYRPADSRLKAVLLDRSQEESFVAVQLDTMGRIFVGGREALFVYEPNGRGGYQPRRELYRFPPDSWLASIEIRGDDLYVMTAAALYLFPRGRTKREGLQPKRLVWGLPLDLHVSFHCLAWGPGGDLYFNSGDPLLNYGDFNRPDHWGHWTLFTQPAGTRVPYTGQGGVYRCRPEGSRFQCVAGGLRGCFGLGFDRSWNLFTNDNDHESIPDRYSPARLLHVTPHADFAWPRGWMASKNPDRADLLQTMVSTLGREVPVGQTYYDESYFPRAYRHNLLLARWGQFLVSRYPLRPRGATITSQAEAFLDCQHQARPIGVAVGRGGRVFATISYMANNEASPHYTSDLVMITLADDPATHPFEAYDAPTARPQKLWAELSNPSWQRRYKAHVELLRRGAPLLVEATERLARVKDDDPALLHLPWLAGASGKTEAARQLSLLARQSRAEVRLQAIRALTEFPALRPDGAVFLAALGDADPSVQLAGLAAFFDPGLKLPLDKVTALARSKDSYLRQTACKLLARRATLEQLVSLTRSRDTATRLAGVLAAGFRLTVPPGDQPPPTQVKLTFPADNAFFKGRIRYADGEVDLRASGRIGSFTIAELWKAVKPTPEQKDLFRLLLARLQDPAEPVQLQAAYFLSLLNDPRSEPRIAQVIRALREKRLAAAPLREVNKAWGVGPFDDGGRGFAEIHPPEIGAIDLAAEYKTKKGKRTWQTISGRGGLLELQRLASSAGTSSYAYCRLHSSQRHLLLLQIEVPCSVKVWHNGREVARAGATDKKALFLDVQPGSNDLLVRCAGMKKSARLAVRYRACSPVTATLPEKFDLATLAQRLKHAADQAGDAKIDPAFFKIDWPKEVAKGKTETGRRLFGTLGCVKCHAITADQQGGGGPSLAGAGSRFTVPYLVESILLPNKQVADVFRSTSIVTRQGQSLSGLVVNETADQLELLQPDTTRRTVLKKDIEERTVENLSPMPAGLVKKPEELRDLLAYLLSKNPSPP